MYIITVEFTIAESHLENFMVAMKQQAANSLKLEADCHQFNIAMAEKADSQILLYEMYSDRAAFEAHLASDHFASFNETVSDWIIDKSVQGWYIQ